MDAQLASGNLTRVLTTVYGAESTSVYWYPDINGHSYLMAVVQHPYRACPGRWGWGQVVGTCTCLALAPARVPTPLLPLGPTAPCLQWRATRTSSPTPPQRAPRGAPGHCLPGEPEHQHSCRCPAHRLLTKQPSSSLPAPWPLPQLHRLLHDARGQDRRQAPGEPLPPGAGGHRHLHRQHRVHLPAPCSRRCLAQPRPLLAQTFAEVPVPKGDEQQSKNVGSPVRGGESARGEREPSAAPPQPSCSHAAPPCPFLPQTVEACPADAA